MLEVLVLITIQGLILPGTNAPSQESRETHLLSGIT